MKLRVLLVLLIVMLMSSSCSIFQFHTPVHEEEIEEIEQPPFLHVINSPKETLGQIAEWYTGDFNNWKAIAQFNGKGTSSIVRLGESLYIPHEMLVREDVLKLGNAAAPKKPQNIETTLKKKIERDERFDLKEIPKQQNEQVDLDELSTMVDMFDEEENPEALPLETPSPEAAPEALKIPATPHEPLRKPVEINDEERRRIELLQELLKK